MSILRSSATAENGPGYTTLDVMSVKKGQIYF